jgi:putative hydrolase
MDAIDWSTAQRVGELVAGSPPYGGILSDSVAPLAQDFAERVSAYSGLTLPEELPALEAVDRPAWIAANLKTMRPLMEPLVERASGGLDARSNLRRQLSRGWKDAGSPLSGAMRAASEPLSDALRAGSGLLLGAQVGALTGMLSTRVLGQYDLALLDESVTPRLLLVAPNLAQASTNLRVDREELLTWVTIHEITHAVQFSGAPWLRAHLAGMLKELIDGLQVSISVGQLLKMPDSGDLRQLVERLRRGELMRVTLGEDRWGLVERMQATMSLVEGHAEHVMDAVGAEVLPSLPRLRAAMDRRRGDRGLPWRVLERLLGLELKMRQYEVGRRFCDAVVADGGPPALAQAWRSPETLPSTAELESPELWIARMGRPAAQLESSEL